MDFRVGSPAYPELMSYSQIQLTGEGCLGMGAGNWSLDRGRGWVGLLKVDSPAYPPACPSESAVQRSVGSSCVCACKINQMFASRRNDFRMVDGCQRGLVDCARRGGDMFLVFLWSLVHVCRTPVCPKPSPPPTNLADTRANGTPGGPANGSGLTGYSKCTGLRHSPKIV